MNFREGSSGHRQQDGRALEATGIKPHHLGLTQAGHPKHPLARGKHRIPADQQPAPFVTL